MVCSIPTYNYPVRRAILISSVYIGTADKRQYNHADTMNKPQSGCDNDPKHFRLKCSFFLPLHAALLVMISKFRCFNKLQFV